MSFVRSNEQLADIFTKAVDKASHWSIFSKLGSRNLYEPNLRGLCDPFSRAPHRCWWRWDAEEGHRDPS
jgi:hypothetical protein